MGQLVVAREFQRRSPETLERIMRAYTEGVAALRDPGQKSRVTKAIAYFSRLKEARSIDEIYNDAANTSTGYPASKPKQWPRLWK